MQQYLDGNLLVGMRYVPSNILAVEILRYSFDLDGFVDGCEITVGVASS